MKIVFEWKQGETLPWSGFVHMFFENYEIKKKIKRKR